MHPFALRGKLPGVSTFAELLSNLSPDERRRADEFEEICRWFLKHDPVYRRIIDRVWLWREWPDRWGADAGIDLVARTRDGHLWAIQAKAYNPAYNIKKKDVDTFLSESARAQFSYRLLIATTDLIGHRAKRTIDAQEKPVGVLLRSALEQAQVSWPRSPADLRAKPMGRRKPYPHNRTAVRAVVAGFKRHDRGQLIMACGTGKTLVGMWTAERLQCQRTLVLVPSLSLLAQTLREWSANSSTEFSFLPVCSDESVTEPDALTQHTSDLGVPATTEPGAIANFLKEDGPRVVLATYQSSQRLVEASTLGAPQFDLTIADEAHRCAGPVDGQFSTVLGDVFPTIRRLFMTATPRYLTTRMRRAAARQELVLSSMDDEAKFGTPFFTLSFGEAIHRKLLSDYQVAIVGVDNLTYLDYAQRGVFVTVDGETSDARTLAGHIGLARAMQTHDLRRVISFHGRIGRAASFSQYLPQVIAWMPEADRPTGLLWTDYVSGEMSSGRRDTKLRHLRDLEFGERGVLSNARCLAEGVNVPAVDGVAFIDPRQSQIDIVQAIGRVLRSAKGKKIGTVVVPVFIADHEDAEAALADSAFDAVWAVLRALRAHDERLADMLDDARRALGRQESRGSYRPPAIHWDLPITVGEDFFRSFDVRLVEQSSAAWEAWFGRLEAFVQRTGHAQVPKGWEEGGFRLGEWVQNQRSLYGRGELSADRARRLEQVPGWIWSVQDDLWERSFAILTRYVEETGTSLVPSTHCREGIRLGQWVVVQRRMRTIGKLDDVRARRLEAFHDWTWNTRDARWEEMFSELQRFVAERGTARVPRRDPEYRKLSTWVMEQRTGYREGWLDPVRAHRLEELHDWSWDKFGDQWERGYSHLKAFADRTGRARMPADCVDEDGFPLGQWVGQQRDAHKKGTLTKDREERLEALRGWAWDGREAIWEDGFEVLQQFVAREGHARVAAKWIEDGFPLGSWVSTQRAFRARGTLKPNRARKLEEVTGWIWVARSPAPTDDRTGGQVYA